MREATRRLRRGLDRMMFAGLNQRGRRAQHLVGLRRKYGLLSARRRLAGVGLGRGRP